MTDSCARENCADAAEDGDSDVPRALILLGAPGAGKGTVAGMLVKRAGFIHLSTGDEIRRIMAEPASSLGLLCRPYMERGHFVPDEIALQIADAFLTRRPAGRPVLLDGFPRNIAQVPLMDALLDRHHLASSGVFWLNARESDLIPRLTGRRLCPSCGLLTHASQLDPAHLDDCPACGGRLVCRPDDQPALIAERMRSFREQTGPMVELFRRRGQLCELPAGESPARLVDAILQKVVA